jgi:hypothetical protein
MSVIGSRHRRISALLRIISVLVCLLTAATPASASIAGRDYTYDYRNRLIGVEEKQSGNWNTTAEYKYDAQNRRILKVVTNLGDLNGTTRFIWSGDSDWLGRSKLGCPSRFGAACSCPLSTCRFMAALLVLCESRSDVHRASTIRFFND